MRAFRRPEMIVSVAAMVVALSGGAFAAGGLINGTKIANGTISGTKLANGTIAAVKLNPHARSVADPVTGNLGAGVTLRGFFDIAAPATRLGDSSGNSISFGFALSGVPAVSVILPGGAATPACPGSVANPTAARHNLCIYELAKVNSSDVQTDPGRITTFGAEIFAQAVGSTFPTDFAVDGTWAVRN